MPLCAISTILLFCITSDYHCGSDTGWSDLFHFTNRRTDPSWAPWIGVYGDMGSVNGQSIPRLQQEVARKTLDVILHVGDFAYDLDTVSFLSSVVFRPLQYVEHAYHSVNML